MSAINEHTGDSIMSKSSEAYRDNYDKIFRSKTINKSKWINDLKPVRVFEGGYTRSHPHENMSEECEKLTVVAREKYLERIQEFKEYTLNSMEGK